jgi:lipopolysaccharide transport system ATP-binding protein
MAHIRLEGVELALPTERTDVSILRRGFRRCQVDVPRPVLRGVDLTIEDGERVALVGPDEIGKRALLQILADRIRADGGDVLVMGKVLHLADVAKEVDPEATGWQNIERRVGPGDPARQLAAFTGLEEFLDLPAHCYSSGMRWRLGFALATAASADVLLCDLVGGGDLAFRDRAERRLLRLIESSRIAVLAGQDAALFRLCRRTICLEEGRLTEQQTAESPLAA